MTIRPSTTPRPASSSPSSSTRATVGAQVANKGVTGSTSPGHSQRDTFVMGTGSPGPNVSNQKQPVSEYMRTTGGVGVHSQQEAGDYYCEHTCWVANFSANQASSSILKGPQGPLVGFLHVPGDGNNSANLSQVDRHKQTTEVVGAAFRGYVDTIRSQGEKGPVKLLITGYGQFGSTVTDNPTGDFVSHPENLDRAMEKAFGKLPGKAVDGGPNPRDVAGPPACRQYTVTDPKDPTKTFEVQVKAKQLEVDDGAIDGGPNSLQHELKEFQPQAELSLGVNMQATDYAVVVRSDLGGTSELNGALDRNGAIHHDRNNRTSSNASNDGTTGMATGIAGGEYKNAALGEAILNGQGRVTVRQGDTLTSIARRMGTSVDELLKLNPKLTSKSTIYAGETLAFRKPS